LEVTLRTDCLLNREITGNFADFSLHKTQSKTGKAAVCLGFLDKFPAPTEQGILITEQGILLADQSRCHPLFFLVVLRQNPDHTRKRRASLRAAQDIRFPAPA
jgi:hypothetical protein